MALTSSSHGRPGAALRPRWLLRPAGFHLLTRVLALAGLGLGAWLHGLPFSAVLLRWDGRYYQQIALSGYPRPLPVGPLGGIISNPAAFFPLFPYATRPLMGSGASFLVAALLLNLVLSTTAAVLIAQVVASYAARSVALVTSYLWSAFPLASVLSVPYTESIFSCTAAASLLAALRRRWELAGLLGFLCATSRPTGVILVGALGLVGVHELVRRHVWRPIAAAALAGLGTLAALAVVGHAVGRWDGWFATEREGWHLKFDGGASLVRWVGASMTGDPTPFKVAFVLAVVLGLVLGLLALLRRPPLPVAAYLLLGLVAAVGQGGQQYLAQLRYLLPLFPLLVPAASFALRLPVPVRVAGLTGLSVVSGAVGLYYFSLADGAP